MRTWKLTSSSPQTLTLAADSRLMNLDYTNDQIWELLLGTGDPSAVLLQTTYGLRARNMRLFPLFEEAHKVVGAPAEFTRQVEIHSFAPNYLSLGFSPFPGIDVFFEYWVPDCQTVSGRVLVENNSTLHRNVKLTMCSLLNPTSPEGQPMVPKKIEVANVLQGRTEDLTPVLFLTGGASSVTSPYPGLVHSISLAPNQTRRFTWVLASQPDEEQSFRKARLTASLNFDAYVDQIEMQAARNIEVFTGNQDWDACLAMGQKTALGLIHSQSMHLKHPSFVSSRLPEQGYSPEGSGIDYSHPWNGQNVLEAWYLMQYLLPGHPQLAKGILQNFFDTQLPDGFIDLKPGLAGQRSSFLAIPLLAAAVWEIYLATEDTAFLAKVFDPLVKYGEFWLRPEHDRDGDGAPEWNNAIQSGFNENPMFCTWLSSAQAADSTLVESPDLAAYLYREIRLIQRMAVLLGQQEQVASLDAAAEKLQEAVQETWNSRRGTYQYRDRDSHQTQKGKRLFRGKGSGKFSVDAVFDHPTRVLLRLTSDQLPPPSVKVRLDGKLSNGKRAVCNLTPSAISWQGGHNTLTLEDLYLSIDKLEIKGLPDDGGAALRVLDHTLEDQTLFTPLWAGIPTEEQVDIMVNLRLSEKRAYRRKYGMPACPKPAAKGEESMWEHLWLPWNMMVGEGLLAYGRRGEAADLVSRMMSGIIGSLKREHAFRSHYHADTAKPAGQRNSLFGLPPLGLFLSTLGVRPITPWKVEISSLNPFPWDIRVKYQGMQILSTAADVKVTFPDGEEIIVNQQIPCLLHHTEAPQEKQED